MRDPSDASSASRGSQISADENSDSVALLEHGGSADRGDSPREMSGKAATWNVVLFCLLVAFLFADTQLMAPNLTAIANDFGFSPKVRTRPPATPGCAPAKACCDLTLLGRELAQERDEKLGGAIAFAFFLLGAPAALLIG